jgi:hypothetical protein
MKGEDEDTLDTTAAPMVQLEQINDDDAEACEACTI